MNGLTPYYEQDGITIYCGDNRRILPLLDDFDLLLTDPPYGISESIKANKRAIDGAKRGGLGDYKPKFFAASDWDSKTPDNWLLQLAIAKSRQQIIWGGNYFDLPPCKGPLIWDKENGETDFADGEVAWNNLGIALRIKRHLWNGMLRKDREERSHPTQKPLDVMSWCLSHAPEAKTILDPWMGSGTTLVAAKLRGLKAVGIEINEEYCEIARRRLSQGVLIPA